MFKVVAVDNKGRLSSVIARWALKVQYRPGQWADAPIGGLLAFASLEAARRFADGFRARGQSVQIWEAEGHGAVELPEKCVLPGALRIAEARQLWSGGPGDSSWPSDTVAYIRIKLIRRIE
jgi:hypothetical protein